MKWAAAKAGVEYVEIGISGRGTVAEIREKALHAKRMADEAGLPEANISTAFPVSKNKKLQYRDLFPSDRSPRFCPLPGWRNIHA